MPWTPPDTPDPSEILNSAAADTRDGSHTDALAKFLWFHQNALQYDEALSGVRLSFALAYWLRLADLYPPARAAFVRTRDQTETAFAAEATSDRFHDLAALNRELGDGPRTADAFAAVARRDPAAAEGLYHVAEPFLIAAGRYAECGPFLDPPNRLWLARVCYEVMSESEGARSSGEDQPPKLARTFYVEDVATLVALLALNGRPDEAARVRTEALAVVEDEEFRVVLDAAMSGHLPPPAGY
jgi:hypothetical protein